MCGGDGSVGWVLKEIDTLQLKVHTGGTSINNVDKQGGKDIPFRRGIKYVLVLKNRGIIL